MSHMGPPDSRVVRIQSRQWVTCLFAALLMMWQQRPEGN